MTGLGLVGFLDDFIKIRKQRWLGLTAAAKFVGQLVVGDRLRASARCSSATTPGSRRPPPACRSSATTRA